MMRGGAMLAVVAVLMAGVALQTIRLGWCQDRNQLGEVCEEVDDIEGDVRDATDDDLIDSITD